MPGCLLNAPSRAETEPQARIVASANSGAACCANPKQADATIPNGTRCPGRVPMSATVPDVPFRTRRHASSRPERGDRTDGQADTCAPQCRLRKCNRPRLRRERRANEDERNVIPRGRTSQ
ncbi:MAG: hypothetical protein D6725_00445 [Planctomycetota bacterium]|nr:MAG: hypothetical protein D6725_00445 [Planctomycetota bacterium]